MSIFYGDNIRWFIGSVINNNDTELKLGRVQVRIYGIHDNLETILNEDLPWAHVMAPSTEDGTSGLGFKPNLKNGAQVFGIFLDGKTSQAPLILGSMPKMEMVTQDMTNNTIATGTVKDTNKGAKAILDEATRVDTSSHAEKNWKAWSNTPDGSPAGHVVNDDTGLSNGEKAFNYFLNKGFSNEQSAGIVGNLAIESGPELITTTDKPASILGGKLRGIAGWGTTRYRRLRNFAGVNNLNITLLQTQLDFIMHDLENNPSLGLSQLKSTTTVPHATSAFATRYLGIAKHKFNDDYPERGEESIEQERIDFANGTFGRFV